MVPLTIFKSRNAQWLFEPQQQPDNKYNPETSVAMPKSEITSLVSILINFTLLQQYYKILDKTLILLYIEYSDIWVWLCCFEDFT